MPHKPTDLKEAMEAAAGPELELRFRPMFGGISAYAGGRIFCTLSDVGLALKLEGAAHAALLKIKGAKPLQYEPSMPPSKSYVVVPRPMLADRAALRDWISQSVAGVCAPPAPKSRKKPTARTRRRARV